MKLEHSFEIAAPIETVWEALIDLERVAPCLPGATITGHDEDGTYHGSFTVKLGPTTANYTGTVTLGEVDKAQHLATLHARGTDKRGQGGATATVENRLATVDGGTRVDTLTDMTITGRLARFGRGGMIEDISHRLLRDFAGCLQTQLASQPPAEGAPAAPQPAQEVRGISLFFSVLWERIKRLFGGAKA